jgi:hypothetical protein
MVETVDEFKDELADIREEMRLKGAYADTKMVASWLDRLIMAMEKLTPTLDLMGEGIEVVAENEECACCMGGAPAKRPAAKKKAVKAKKRR